MKLEIPNDYVVCPSCHHRHPYILQEIKGPNRLFGIFPWFGEKIDIIDRGIAKKCMISCPCETEQQILHLQGRCR